MTPEQAKLKQREDARRRSRQAPRRASSQAVSSDQSEVTEEAPAVYRVPQINVPEDLQGVARLIQTELAKIEQSQTILLSLWEKVRDQTNSDGYIEFTKEIRINNAGDGKVVRIRPDVTHYSYDEWRNDNDYSRDAYMGMVPGSRDMYLVCEQGGLRLELMKSYPAIYTPHYYYTDGVNDATTLGWMNAGAGEEVPLTTIRGGAIINNSSHSGFLTGDMNKAPMNSVYFAYQTPTATNGAPGAGPCIDIATLNGGYRAQLVFDYSKKAAYFRAHSGDNPNKWQDWSEFATTAAIEEMKFNIKKEIYAELLALNPGIVIPQTD